MGSCGTAWAPRALCHARDTAAAAGGVSLAAQGGPVLPLPVCLRLGPGLCPHLPLQTPGLWLACAHAKAPQGSPGRTHCRSGTGAGRQVLAAEKGHLMAASIPASGSVTCQPHQHQGRAAPHAGRVLWRGRGCSQSAACPRASPDTASLPLSPHRAPCCTQLPWQGGPAWFPTLPSPSSPSGCSHGNGPAQSPLLSQSHSSDVSSSTAACRH